MVQLRFPFAEWLSPLEARLLLDVTDRRVRQLVAARRLETIMVGSQRLISKESALRYAAERKPWPVTGEKGGRRA